MKTKQQPLGLKKKNDSNAEVQKSTPVELPETGSKRELAPMNAKLCSNKKHDHSPVQEIFLYQVSCFITTVQVLVFYNYFSSIWIMVMLKVGGV